MSAILFGIFDFIAKHKWAQWLLIGIATIVTFGFYLAWRDNGVKKRERQRAEAETIIVVNKIERKSSDAANQAVAARDAAPVYPDASSVPDDIAERIFRD